MVKKQGDNPAMTDQGVSTNAGGDFVKNGMTKALDDDFNLTFSANCCN